MAREMETKLYEDDETSSFDEVKTIVKKLNQFDVTSVDAATQVVSALIRKNLHVVKTVFADDQNDQFERVSTCIQNLCILSIEWLMSAYVRFLILREIQTYKPNFLRENDKAKAVWDDFTKWSSDSSEHVLKLLDIADKLRLALLRFQDDINFFQEQNTRKLDSRTVLALFFARLEKHLQQFEKFAKKFKEVTNDVAKFTSEIVTKHMGGEFGDFGSKTVKTLISRLQQKHAQHRVVSLEIAKLKKDHLIKLETVYDQKSDTKFLNKGAKDSFALMKKYRKQNEKELEPFQHKLKALETEIKDMKDIKKQVIEKIGTDLPQVVEVISLLEQLSENQMKESFQLESIHFDIDTVIESLVRFFRDPHMHHDPEEITLAAYLKFCEFNQRKEEDLAKCIGVFEKHNVCSFSDLHVDSREEFNKMFEKVFSDKETRPKLSSKKEMLRWALNGPEKMQPSEEDLFFVEMRSKCIMSGLPKFATALGKLYSGLENAQMELKGLAMQKKMHLL